MSDSVSTAMTCLTAFAHDGDARARDARENNPGTVSRPTGIDTLLPRTVAIEGSKSRGNNNSALTVQVHAEIYDTSDMAQQPAEVAREFDIDLDPTILLQANLADDRKLGMTSWPVGTNILYPRSCR